MLANTIYNFNFNIFSKKIYNLNCIIMIVFNCKCAYTRIYIPKKKKKTKCKPNSLT